MKSIKSFFKRYWAVLRRPSVHYSLGALTLG
ncbi:MAG: cytochrome C, partial [Pseudomonas stutzeri]|nr:cytochrome C [Stutzerimonas stutzeri]